MTNDEPPLHLRIDHNAYMLSGAYCHKHGAYARLCWDGARLGPNCCIDHALVAGEKIEGLYTHG